MVPNYNVVSPSAWRHFPTLHTERLTLRRFELRDIHKVYEALSNKKITHYYAVHFDTLEDTEEQMDWFETIWREQTGMWWAICPQGQKELIGACGYNHYQARLNQSEIGYWLLPSYQGQGIAREALHCMLHYGLNTLGLQRIEARVKKGNHKSEQLLVKEGFAKEKTLKGFEGKNGKLIDIHVYCLGPNGSQ